MNAGKLAKLSTSLGALLLIGSCTVSCNAKEAGAKENAEALKTYVERIRVKMAKKVTCAAGSKQKKGAKFDCTVTFEDGEVQVWNMNWVDESLFKAFPVIKTKTAEDDLAGLLKKRKLGFKSITCPKRILFKPPSKYVCKVVRDTGETVEVRLNIDKDGKSRWEPVKPIKPTAGADKKPAAPTKPATPKK